MKQTFYCKKCSKSFEIEDDEKYYNYNCPDCNTLSLPEGYLGVKFKGLDTVKS